MRERGEENLWKPLWSEISDKIDRLLPGELLFSQALPIEEGDVAEGLAIRREGGHYILLYFTLLPAEVDPSDDHRMIGGQSADDWELEIGYQQDFDTLEDAKAEAKRILEDLPTPEYMQQRGCDFFLKLLRP